MTPVKIRRLAPGDRLECNVHGRVFTATFDHMTPEHVRVTPESKNITYFHVQPRQVVKRLKTSGYDPGASQVR